MGAALRAHLIFGALALLSLAGWLRHSLVLPDPPDGEGQLLAIHEDLVEGKVSASDAPALASLLIRDSSQPLSARLSWLSAVLDPRLQDAVQVPAFAKEDGHALLALLLHPALEEEARSACPELPESLGVLCDSEAWQDLKSQTLPRLLRVLSSRPDFAAAARVGGNDLALQVSDQLCRMGSRGRALALQLAREGEDERVRSLGILALGCAGNRTGVGSLIEARLGEGGAVGLAATLECALQEDCALGTEPLVLSQAEGALKAYARTLAGGEQ